LAPELPRTKTAGKRTCTFNEGAPSLAPEPRGIRNLNAGPCLQ